MVKFNKKSNNKVLTLSQSINDYIKKDYNIEIDKNKKKEEDEYKEEKKEVKLQLTRKDMRKVKKLQKKEKKLRN